MGHSFGSYFAMNYVILYPDAFSEMVLTGTMPPPRDMVSQFSETLLSRLKAEQRLQYEAFDKAEEEAADDVTRDRLETAKADLISDREWVTVDRNGHGSCEL